MTMPAVRLHGFPAAPYLLAGGGLAALLAAPPGVDGPTVCPFALLTGHACPGCGLTRAVVALVHGDVGLALSYHPLVGLIALEMAVGWALWAARRSGRLRAVPPAAATLVLALTGAALLVVWLVRMASGTLPPV